MLKKMTRWTSWTELADLHRDLDSIFGCMFGETGSRQSLDSLAPAAIIRGCVKRRAIITALLLSGFLAAVASAQHRDVDQAQNLRNCMEGFGACDRSLLTSLTASEIETVTKIEKDRNRLNCETGFACDHTLLGSSEAMEVVELWRTTK